MLEENLGAQAGVHSMEVVRLIWGPLNTGFTVTLKQLLPQLFLQRQWLSTLQLAASGRLINRGCIYLSLPRCVVSLEVQGLEWLLHVVPTRILLDIWQASLLGCWISAIPWVP